MSNNRYPAFVKSLARSLPDPLYIQIRYFMRFRRFCNLRNPKTYNEKLQWLKLNYRVPGEWKLVDKHEVKSHVAKRIGGEYVIPTLGLFNSAEDIDFDALPDSFVLKCTHDSGGIIVVRDKSGLDTHDARVRLRIALAKNYFYSGREPHYKQIQPRVIAEPYLEDAATGELPDYKFFCFNGEVKAMFVASERATGNVKFDYFDCHFSPLHIRQPYPNADALPKKPVQFERMVELAESLSREHPHVRVDFYEVNGQIYFGELTFYHFSGRQPFRPAKWDRIFGDWLTLPHPLREK